MKRKKIFKQEFFELSGCVHVHSEHSFDAFIPTKDIISAARRKDVDFITINDHLTYKAREDTAVQAEKDIFVIVGVEIHDKSRNNHYLVFNSDKIIKNSSVEEYAKQYKTENAICFAAHPIDKRKSKKFRRYVWTDKQNTDFDGLEIWNFLSSWMGKLIPKLNGFFCVFFPSLFVKKPYPDSLKYWDELNNLGLRKSAIGSVDAHSQTIGKKLLKIRFLTHKFLFGTIRTNVLINCQKTLSEQSILKAIKNGNSYIINYKLGNPYNFFAGISNQSKSAVFGEELKFASDLYFYFRLPKIARVKLFRNGKKIASKLDEKGRFPITEKGNYRLEISRFGFGWIYTNNIYVS